MVETDYEHISLVISFVEALKDSEKTDNCDLVSTKDLYGFRYSSSDLL